MKLTEWYSGKINPVRTGVYKRFFPKPLGTYSYWNGKYWGLTCDTVEKAYQYRHLKSYNQNVFWRGILKD